MSPHVCLGLLIASSLAWTTAQAAQPTPELLWQTSGFSGPESVVYDSQRQQFYVSNMASRGDSATPGDGFISTVDRHGNISQLKWVTGLQNPKGLALANGRLYVGDDDALVEVDLDRASIVARHAPEDGQPARFNDVTADAQGRVYAFSSRLDAIYRLDGGQFGVWTQVDVARTGKFNGLRVVGEQLLAGSWVVPGPEGEQLGHLSTFELKDASLGRIGTAPIGHIDGIEPDGRGGLTLTDWTRGQVLHVDAQGQTQLLLQLIRGSADHLYLPEQQLLLVPFLMNDRMAAYRWAPAEH